MANSITANTQSLPGAQLPVSTGATILASDIAPKQLSDNNGAGTIFGYSATDLISFYGATPVAQVDSPLLDAISQNASSGVITIFNSTQTPSSVATITVAEQAVTMPAVPPMLTTDLCIVNKPTVDAGIGLCMCRVSTTTTVALVFANTTAGTLTPVWRSSWAT